VSGENALRGIERAAKQRQEAADLREAATADLRRFIAQAHKEKVPVTQIAKAARVSRQAIYDALAEQPSS
jgi:DNA invertase Pin-like site-specific DNA recombinase